MKSAKVRLHWAIGVRWFINRLKYMNYGVPRFPNTEFIRYLNQTGIITNYVNQEMTIDELIAALQQKWDEIE